MTKHTPENTPGLAWKALDDARAINKAKAVEHEKAARRERAKGNEEGARRLEEAAANYRKHAEAEESEA